MGKREERESPWAAFRNADWLDTRKSGLSHSRVAVRFGAQLLDGEVAAGRVCVVACCAAAAACVANTSNAQSAL
jgi:hypothetical protein